MKREILILYSDGRWLVRNVNNDLRSFPTPEEARIYAAGLRAGYAAAVETLGEPILAEQGAA